MPYISPTDEEKRSSELWRFNPQTRRHVLRDGSVWRKLVLSGKAKDPEMEAKWAHNREQLRQQQIENCRTAKILGYGIGGGVCKQSTRGAMPRALKDEPATQNNPVAEEPVKEEPVKEEPVKEPDEDEDEPENEPIQIVLKRLIISNKDMFTNGITRDEAERFLRKKLADSGRVSRNKTKQQPNVALRWST